jgi:mRNA interferase RelE/StbE
MSEPYALQFTDKALDSLKRLDKTIAQRILKKLEWLADNAATIVHVALTGDWSGFYRVRIGDYRVIYRLDHDMRVIIVEVIGHRSEIYDE